MARTDTARNVPNVPTPAEQIHSLTVELARHVVALQDAVRQRDEAKAEVERMRPIALAAISWRESPDHDDTCDALVAAVDEMGEVAW